MKYTHDQHLEFAQRVRDTSFALLPNHFSVELIDAWREAFAPLLQAHIEREGRLQNRGTARYYVTLPFEDIYADARVFEDPDVLAVVHELAGDDYVMCQLATDTPLSGSEFQDLHRDAPPLFPEWGRETPPFQLAVNFPLVDVTPENGPMEVAPATHLMEKNEALRRVESGESPLQQILMKRGDVLIRDVRAIHRGTPNTTGEPRPMVVIGYSRRWLLRPEVSIRIPKATYAALSPHARHMLRFNEVVETLEPESREVYQAFAY